MTGYALNELPVITYRIVLGHLMAGAFDLPSPDRNIILDYLVKAADEIAGLDGGDLIEIAIDQDGAA